MKRRLMMGLVLLAGCSGQQASRELPASTAAEPDIVLISIDTLRPDHLGTYGYDRPTSPFLDEAAAGGIVFEQAWSSSPWTLPAHATMFTALRPDHHGAIEESLTINPDAARLPEALEALGYQRAAFVTTPFVGARYGFDRGFDHFEELIPSDFSLATALDADSVATRVLDWAETLDGSSPAFAFVHLYDVHYPCDPPEPFNTRFNRVARPDELEYENYFHYQRNPLSESAMDQQVGQYDEEIAFVDAVLRDLCTTWAASRPNTVFVVVSDHGEEHGERGSWGHGHTLTSEQLHVPWIVWGEGIASGRVQTRVGLEDLAPTLAALAGTSFGPFDGVDRSPALRRAGGDPGDPGAVLASTSRRNTLKVRLHAAPLDMIADLRGRTVELYDLVQDPRAAQNIGPQQGELVTQLWGGMMREIGLPWVARSDLAFNTDGVLISEEGGLHTGELNIVAGVRFALWPLDAVIETSGGSWAALGGALPGADDPLGYEGPRLRVENLELSEEEQERLRALGYAN